MKGFIFIHRAIWNNPIVTKDPDHLAVWIYLLTFATHAKIDTIFNSSRITLNSGQLVTGRKEIARDTKVNESKVQRILKKFESERQIEQQTSRQNRLVSIINWDKYQKETKAEQQNEQQVNSKRTASEQQVNTYNNVNNVNKDNNVILKSEIFEDLKLNTRFHEWISYRKEIKKTLKATTMQAQINKLNQYPPLVAIQMIDQSIENGWTGLFEIKQSISNNKVNKKSNFEEQAEKGQRAKEILKQMRDEQAN